MFREKFLFIQKQMELRLQEIRSSLSHRGNRGNSAECVVRDFLLSYLPPYNRVGTGEIIDTEGRQSTQLDIIIINEHHPNLNELSGPEVFIIEGVACAGEVKTTLSSQDMDTLINSCMTYKSLTPQHIKGATVQSTDADIDRFIVHRPYFIFAFESQLKLETIQKKLHDYYMENNTPIAMQVDAVFCLDKGTICNFGNGKGMYQWHINQVSQPGLQITTTLNESVLFNFMSWISVTIPQIKYPRPPLIEYLLK